MPIVIKTVGILSPPIPRIFIFEGERNDRGVGNTKKFFPEN